MIGVPIPVGDGPFGVAVNPAGTRVYVANDGSNNVHVIDTATNTVIGSPIPVGMAPIALGQFIGPEPPTAWEGAVSFSVKLTSPQTDSSGTRKLVTSNETFAGTISLYVCYNFG